MSALLFAALMSAHTNYVKTTNGQSPARKDLQVMFLEACKIGSKKYFAEVRDFEKKHGKVGDEPYEIFDDGDDCPKK